MYLYAWATNCIYIVYVTLHYMFDNVKAAFFLTHLRLREQKLNHRLDFVNFCVQWLVFSPFILKIISQLR